jgi:hypothetical protein
MEILLGVVGAALFGLGFWLGSRSSGGAWARQVAMHEATEKRLEADIARHEVVFKANRAERDGLVTQLRAAQERQDKLTLDLLNGGARERGQLMQIHAMERKELLDRLTTPPDAAADAPLVGTGRKLHHSEADEIEGTTPAKVAAAARAAAQASGAPPDVIPVQEAEQVVRHIDELAYAEGLNPQ